MNVKNVVKAWRNPAFRSTLSATELAQLPGNPAGMIELSGTALDAVAGGGHGSGKGSGKSRNSGKSSRSGKSGKSGKGSR
jgi:mersacidin/lichenicidin family type 2 lantibiotic